MKKMFNFHYFKKLESNSRGESSGRNERTDNPVIKFKSKPQVDEPNPSASAPDLIDTELNTFYTVNSLIFFKIEFCFPDSKDRKKDELLRLFDNLLKTTILNRDVIGLHFILMIKSFNSLTHYKVNNKDKLSFECEFEISYKTKTKRHQAEYLIVFDEILNHFLDGICNVKMTYKEVPARNPVNQLQDILKGLTRKQTVVIVDESEWLEKWGIKIRKRDGNLYIEHPPLNVMLERRSNTMNQYEVTLTKKTYKKK